MWNLQEEKKNVLIKNKALLNNKTKDQFETIFKERREIEIFIGDLKEKIANEEQNIKNSKADIITLYKSAGKPNRFIPTNEHHEIDFHKFIEADNIELDSTHFNEINYEDPKLDYKVYWHGQNNVYFARKKLEIKMLSRRIAFWENTRNVEQLKQNLEIKLKEREKIKMIYERNALVGEELKKLKNIIIKKKIY